MTQPDPEPVYRMVLAELRRARIDLMPPRSLFITQMAINLSGVDALVPLLERELGEGDVPDPRPRMAAAVAADPVLARITYDPGEQLSRMAPIPWPAGLAPVPIHVPVPSDGKLPEADAVIVTFTAAEGRALADVLTPGVQITEWNAYTDNWSEFEPMLTGRSPARFSKRLGSWHLSQIGDRRTLLIKSELHPATDGPELPLAKLVQQIVAQVKPSLFITTGTAGGVARDSQIGDVVLADWVKWDCQQRFKNEEWAHEAYQTSLAKIPAFDVAALIAPNFARLPSDLLIGRQPLVWGAGADTISTDFFAMGDTTDSYGLLKYDANAGCVEMDDAAVGLAMRQMGYPISWLSVRSASDPVMPGDEPLEKQRKDASAIYERWGYWTQISAVICCWAAIVGN